MSLGTSAPAASCGRGGSPAAAAAARGGRTRPPVRGSGREARASAGEWRSAGPDETRAIGAGLARELAPDGVLLLHGELGSGKTVLAQGVAAGLGIDPREVVSPSFTLIREHAGPGGRLIHVDLYRLEPGEAAALGLEELLAGPGVKVVEWAERLPFPPPAGTLRLDLERLPDGGRTITRRREGKEGR